MFSHFSCDIVVIFFFLIHYTNEACKRNSLFCTYTNEAFFFCVKEKKSHFTLLYGRTKQ